MPDISATTSTQNVQTVTLEDTKDIKDPAMRYCALAMQRIDLLDQQISSMNDKYDQQLKDMEASRDALKEMREAQSKGTNKVSKKTEDWMRNNGISIPGGDTVKAKDWDNAINSAEDIQKRQTADNVKFDTELKQKVTMRNDLIASVASYMKQALQTLRSQMPT